MKNHYYSKAILLCILLFTQPVIAADFTIVNGQVETSTQSLTDNETGTIEAGGQLNTGASMAINAAGINITVDNAGSISTTGNDAYGIFSQYDTAAITNSGSISTIGSWAVGIVSRGDTAVITNSGSISTTATNGYGIWSDGYNATVNNSGSVSTTGDSADAIHSEGDTAVINNSGSIATTGKSFGIYSLGDNADINNSGSIATIGWGAIGIFSRGDNSAINNSGSISTTGDLAYGIWLNGLNSTVNNSGSVSTTGDGVSGIIAFRDNSTVNNSGSVSTTGQNNAYGIGSRGDNSTVNNSGSVSTTGDNAYGIDSQGDNAAIDNSGSISTTGDGAHGIWSSGADATINNSGLISAVGTDAYAILGFSNNITLNLLTGSRVVGRIDLGDNGGDLDTANIYGGGASFSLTLENTEVINLIGAAGIVVGNTASSTVTTIDPTGESTRSAALADLSSAIHNSVSRRMAHTTPLKPVQVASLTLSPGMLFQQRKPIAWVQVFGVARERDREGGALAYDHDLAGFTLAYEWDTDKTRVGLMTGMAHSKTATQTSSFETETDSYFIGAYGHFNLGAVNLTTSILGGYSKYENERLVIDNINGYEVARADFDGVFLSPSLTLSSAYTISDRLELRPSAAVNYSVARLDSYRESGTTRSNLEIDARTVRALMARVQLAAAYEFNQSSELELRLGVTSRNTSDDDTQVNLAGSHFCFANVGDDNMTGGFAGINLRIATLDNLSLSADVEFGSAEGDESYTSAQLSLEYSF